MILEGPAAALEPLRCEAGGHRWQRVPPSEKRGRVHTSTVTVAVLEAAPAPRAALDPGEVEIRTQRDSGPGGQHRNKTDSCVVATHRPTGITVKCDGRSQHQNRRRALAELETRLEAGRRDAAVGRDNARRRRQVGSGMRADKVRTYRVQDGRVVDHRSARKASLAKVLRGELECLA